MKLCNNSHESVQLRKNNIVFLHGYKTLHNKSYTHYTSVIGSPVCYCEIILDKQYKNFFTRVVSKCLLYRLKK